MITNFKDENDIDLGNILIQRSFILDIYPNIIPALRTAGLFTCGVNTTGELGLGNITSISSPVQVGSLTTWKYISTGNAFCIAVKTDDTTWGWGNNSVGQLGNLSTTTRSSPVQVASGIVWKKICSGNLFNLGLTSSNNIVTWGSNVYGQLGLGDTNNRSSPVQVGANKWIDIACGNYNAYAIRSDGILCSWGYSSVGQLGTGISSHVSSPVAVGSGVGWKLVRSGADHVLGLKIDNTLWGFGDNAYGQLGTNTSGLNKSTPIQISASTDWKDIFTSLSASSSFAIKTDGTLWAWGRNQYGQLGLGDLTLRSSPTQVGSLNNWARVSIGQDFTLAIKTDGTLWGWGRNDLGQLGLGNRVTPCLSPIQIGNLNTWKYISAGVSSFAAIKEFDNF